MPPGDGHFHRFRALALVLPGAGQIGVEVAFDLVVQLDADDFAATAFDFIADLVIKAVEFGVVEGFFGLLETVIGSLVRTKESAVGESPMANWAKSWTATTRNLPTSVKVCSSESRSW
jgi:hypothetical protein